MVSFNDFVRDRQTEAGPTNAFFAWKPEEFLKNAVGVFGRDPGAGITHGKSQPLPVDLDAQHHLARRGCELQRIG
jgi:hypothetical protein